MKKYLKRIKEEIIIRLKNMIEKMPIKNPKADIYHINFRI